MPEVYGPVPSPLGLDPRQRDHVRSVALLYHRLLGRRADMAGLAAYVAALARGMTLDQVSAAFLASDEYRSTGCRGQAAEAPESVLAMLDGVISPADQILYLSWIETYEQPYRAALEDRLRMRTDLAPAVAVVLDQDQAGPSAWALLGPSLAAQVGVRWEARVFANAGQEAATCDAGSLEAGNLDAANRDAGGLTVLVGAAGRLAPTALAELAEAAAADPAAMLVHADEDAMDASGFRHGPWFKSGRDRAPAGGAWMPDGLLAVRNQVVRELGLAALLGALRDGSDILALVRSRFAAAGAAHVPHVLLHRERPVPAARPRAGAVAVPAPEPLVSVIVPTRDRLDLLAPLLEDFLFRTAYAAREIVIVDNDSAEPATRAYLRRIRRDRRCRVVSAPGPFNWGRLNNLGAAAARGGVLVLMNNDMRVLHPDWLHALVGQAALPAVGAVGAALFYPDGTVQHAGMVLRDNGGGYHVMRHAPPDCADYDNLLFRVRPVSAVTGACIAVRREVFDEVGGIDAENFAVTCSDTDFCLRVAARGYQVLWTPHARLCHLELATRKKDESAAAMARAAREEATLAARWRERLRRDPYWSPNLALTEGPPSLACPPRWAATENV
jgi:GT2 family glycosyltransferase